MARPMWLRRLAAVVALTIVFAWLGVGTLLLVSVLGLKWFDPIIAIVMWYPVGGLAAYAVAAIAALVVVSRWSGARK